MMELMKKIVVVDDDALALETIRIALRDHYQVDGFSDPKVAELHLSQSKPNLIILDLNMPEADGVAVLESWKQKFPEVPVVFCSGETRVERAVECLRKGAADFVTKPFKRDDLLFIVGRCLANVELQQKVEKLQPLVRPTPIRPVFRSRAMQDVLGQLDKLKGQRQLNILITGESGTGKEVIARMIHQQEAQERPFVVANMPAIPASLMESELFGYEKGAFTDAKQSRAGKFELADGGDIFLDEIGDLPYEAQATLLRTLQEKQVQRIGSNHNRTVQFRVISATNRPLKDMIESGKFREDLLYRLNDVVIHLAPLRERLEEIPTLCEHFIEKYSTGEEKPRLSQEAIAQLQAYHWPGNIRELESTIKRVLAFNSEPVIESVNIYNVPGATVGPAPTEMPMPTDSEVQDQSYSNQVTLFERRLFESALERHSGNRRAAMEELKLPRATFYRKVSQLKVPLN